MATLLDRKHEPITLNAGYKDHRELRIHGDGESGKGDRYVLLTARDMRIMAYRLLAEAEVFEAESTA